MKEVSWKKFLETYLCTQLWFSIVFLLKGSLIIGFVILLLRWQFSTFRYYNREEKLLRHIAIVAKFLDDVKSNMECHLKKNSHCFKLHWSYSISFNISNVGEIFLGQVWKDHILCSSYTDQFSTDYLEQCFGGCSKDHQSNKGVSC